MAKQPPKSAADFVPPRPTLKSARDAAKACRGCELWKLGTQTVFGEGPRHAPLMLVGEQPGDAEDLSGHPFVGPAGKLLDRALADAGIDRATVYVTNAVKHFKWEPRGKRRIHAKPNAHEIRACRPWLEAEVTVVHPRLVVCLGATAAQSIIGREFRVTQRRGELVPSIFEVPALATIHPSAILRAPDHESREREMAAFIEDLKVVAKLIG
jgi:uracil-DNA glycosylase